VARLKEGALSRPGVCPARPVQPGDRRLIGPEAEGDHIIAATAGRHADRGNRPGTGSPSRMALVASDPKDVAARKAARSRGPIAVYRLGSEPSDDLTDVTTASDDDA